MIMPLLVISIIILVLKAKRIAIVSSVGWFTAWQMLSVSFLVPGQDFWCSPAYLHLPGDNLIYTMHTMQTLTYMYLQDLPT